jgi:enamine deaminase RidA (YjgF/YER057c/UK114 family)
VVAPGDIAEQMRQALDNLRVALEECMVAAPVPSRSNCGDR